MFRTARSTRRAITRTATALFAAASLTLTGCGAGQYAQSVNVKASILGANGGVGDMSTLNVRLAPTDQEKYPAGSDARVLLYLSNDGINPDTLTSVSTPAAQSVKFSGDPIVPAQTLLDLSRETGRQLTVTGFLEDVYHGVSIPMTFSFANAGSLTINVPIENPVTRPNDREPIEILPPEPTPIWQVNPGEVGGGQAGAGSEAGTSTAPTDANQGGNIEGAPSSTAGTSVSGG